MIAQNYLNELKLNGLAKSSIAIRTSQLKIANNYKPLNTEWSRDDVNRFLLSLVNKKPNTIEWYKVALKKFFTWKGCPEIVTHLKTKARKGNLKRDDILTVDDVNKLVEATTSPLYKAMIAFLFESGARISEALAVRVKDAQETDKGLIVSVPATKTGVDYRRVLCVYSAQYIRNLITYTARSPDDRLFGVNRSTSYEMIAKIGEKAGIRKHCNPHAFRHSQATDMLLRGYPEMLVRKKLGWADDSKMVARYQHVIDDDVIDATAEKAGADLPKRPLATLKQAESLKVADASMQLSKLSEENAELKKEMEEMRAFKKMVEEEFKRNAKAALQQS